MVNTGEERCGPTVYVGARTCVYFSSFLSACTDMRSLTIVSLHTNKMLAQHRRLKGLFMLLSPPHLTFLLVSVPLTVQSKRLLCLCAPTCPTHTTIHSCCLSFSRACQSSCYHRSDELELTLVCAETMVADERRLCPDQNSKASSFVPSLSSVMGPYNCK